MEPPAVDTLVLHLRTFGAEAAHVEVKAAQRKLPDACRETLSAFANSPGGGTLLLGIAEADGFPVLGIDNPAAMASDLASLARDAFEPPLQPQISVTDIDGRPVVVACVAELAREQKPCYVKSLGQLRGTYVRVGASDRRLTSEEVHQLVAERGQPTFDAEPVPAATIEDLDASAVDDYLRRLRTTKPRLWAGETDETILRMTRVLVPDPAGALRPSLAGYLTLGRYPQQYFPS